MRISSCLWTWDFEGMEGEREVPRGTKAFGLVILVGSAMIEVVRDSER